ncbi:MAG: putative MFS-type transporter YcaD [Candidatus Anoxychlamydiales bacterium]|nr:putative MFS-type transporter YcaD [Candidatus Anoxychlamydiales bacterium]
MLLNTKRNIMNQKLKFLNPLIAPLLSLGFIVCSSTPFLTYISLKLQAENFTETIIGIIQSSFYLGFLIGSLQSERIIARIGYIRSFVCFSAIFGTTILIQGMAINAILWIVMRIISGISIAALYVIIESWILSDSSVKTRGRVLSFYMIALYGSQSLSQLIIRFISLDTITPFLLFGVMCYLSIIPVSINYSKTPETSPDVIKKNFFAVYKATPLSFWGSFISGIILGAIYSFLPIYAQLNSLQPSYIMAITIAGGFLLQWPLGHLSDLFDRRKVLIASSLCAAIPSILMLVLPQSAMLSYILCFMIGGFAFVIYPISISQACDKFDLIYTRFVVGLMAATYGIGAISGPFIASLVMEWKVSALFLFIATVSILLSILGIYFSIKYPKITPKEEKGEFMPISAQAPIGADITSKTIELNKENTLEEAAKTAETKTDETKKDSSSDKPDLK